MRDILDFIEFLFDKSWDFFKIDVPGCDFSFGVLLIGVALISVAFKFLSIMLGHNVGEASDGAGYASRASKKYHIPKERHLDVR